MCKGVHMNKSKFIPVLAVVALLSACGTSNKIAVKEPKFDKEGTKVEYTAFISGLEDAASSLTIMSEEKLPSFDLNFKLGTSEEKVFNRNDKVASREFGYESESLKMQYDSNNAVTSEKYENVQYEEYATGQSDSATFKDTFHFNGGTQSVMYDDAEYIANVDLDGKKVGLMNQASETVTYEDLINYYVKTQFLQYSGLGMADNLFLNLKNLNDGQLPYFNFFQNKKVFTFTYKMSLKNEEVRNGDDELVKTVDTTGYQKGQFLLDGNACKFKIFIEYSVVTTYAMDSVEDSIQHYAGEVYEVNYKESVEAEYTLKEINLKPLSYDGFLFMVY